METVFQNEYTVTKERFMDWAKKPIQRNYFFRILAFIHDSNICSFHLLFLHS